MNTNTLEYYEKNSVLYSQSTLPVNMSHLYDEFLPYVPSGGHILDLGCGSGRDSLEFIKRGFQISALDGSESLCRLAEINIGQSVIHQCFDEISFENEFDGIWACASILHLTSKQLPDVMCRLDRALKNNGALYISFKHGAFEGYRSDRYFTDLDENKLAALIKNTKHLQIEKTWLTDDARPDSNDRWINCICIKKC